MNLNNLHAKIFYFNIFNFKILIFSTNNLEDLHAAVEGSIVSLQLVDALQLAQLLDYGVYEVVVVLLGVVAARHLPSATVTAMFV